MFVENVPCDVCEKWVHLLHDPPQLCGRVLCDYHAPCECVECCAIREEVTC